MAGVFHRHQRQRAVAVDWRRDADWQRVIRRASRRSGGAQSGRAVWHDYSGAGDYRAGSGADCVHDDGRRQQRRLFGARYGVCRYHVDFNGIIGRVSANWWPETPRAIFQ